MSEHAALPSLSGKEIYGGNNTDCRCCGPDFKVSGIFSSHMVLQRDKPVHIFGFSSRPGSIVKGELDGAAACAAVGEDKRWMLTFPPHPHSCVPVTMKLSDDRGNFAVFEDILFGDVWLIGGQSNAELHLDACLEADPEPGFDENAPMRLFTQTQKYAAEHRELLGAPQLDIISPEWCWKRPDEKASLNFSAMGWYFGRELLRGTDVPQGLIMCCAGGACLRELVPAELARAMGYFAGVNVPAAGYYNTLINPLIGLNFRGQLFFQGESEGIWRECAERYARELALLVYDERCRFGFDFPFYNVQISNYPKDGVRFFGYADIIRTQQFDAAKLIKDYTLTVDMDLGSRDEDSDWAHSPHKAELGRRLAAQVLAREYGIGSQESASSPMPEEAVLSEDGTKAIVRFTNVNGALKTISGQTVCGFSFGGRDDRKPAAAEIISDCEVSVAVPRGADTSLLGYAFFVSVNDGNANLRGGTGLPAPAFLIPVKKQPD